MNPNKQPRHIIDLLFVILLFCVFTLSSIFLILIGANIYQKTTNDMNHNFNFRTSFAYVTEKIRQHDTADTLSYTTLDDTDILVLSESIDEKDYSTYIYVYDGWLLELLSEKDIPFNPQAGQKILKATSLSIDQPDPLDPSVLSITIDDNTHHKILITTGSKCDSKKE